MIWHITCILSLFGRPQDKISSRVKCLLTLPRLHVANFIFFPQEVQTANCKMKEYFCKWIQNIKFKIFSIQTNPVSFLIYWILKILYANGESWCHNLHDFGINIQRFSMRLWQICYVILDERVLEVPLFIIRTRASFPHA